MSRRRIATGLMVLLLAAARTHAQDNVPSPPAPGRVTTPALEGPMTELEPIPDERPTPADRSLIPDDGATPGHDALSDSEARPLAKTPRAPKMPPATITERPSGSRPAAGAQWVPGYWDWDAQRSEFVWMGGVWKVAPTGSVWVKSRWQRDQDGWYRTPGYWSRRRETAVAPVGDVRDEKRPWRMTGPPAEHPAETATQAPGPDYFFVPGHYAPDGETLAWKAGFWSRSQPGWDWVPARWIRRAGGWEFRDGHWVADPNGSAARIAAKPGPRELDDRDTPPVMDDEVIEERPADRGEVRIFVPRRMPYYVIRPPGSYPYGPAGVVVPGAVPAFVRRILDDVLP